jgi:hypothetical protein
MKRLMTWMLVLGVVTMTVGLAAAQGQSKEDRSKENLTGKWTMKVSGGPHGDAAMSLVVKQDGDKIKAEFNPGHGDDIPLAGTFAKGALAIESPANDDGAKITMTATLKADGTLSGFLSSQMGDMTWTAARIKTN